MDIGERIRLLRKEKNLGQTEFGRKIGLGKTTISKLELGQNSVTDRTVSDICRVYHVDEHWLRTGEGEMFQADEQTFRQEVIERFRLDDLGVAMLDKYSQLDDEGRAVIKELIFSLADGMRRPGEGIKDLAPIARNAHMSETAEEIDIEAEVASYRRELELQQDTRMSSASVSGEGVRRVKPD